jgi:hypothetical protein
MAFDLKKFQQERRAETQNNFCSSPIHDPNPVEEEEPKPVYKGYGRGGRSRDYSFQPDEEKP